MSPVFSRRFSTVLAAAIIAVAPLLPASAAAAPEVPTVVLVHGAFADTTSWDGVAAVLRERGHAVVVVDNPLRGPRNDAQAVKNALDAIEGPVVLVGHSYGGAVITNIDDAKVRANVYIAAFAPAAGEFVQGLLNPLQYPGSRLLPPALQVRPVEGGLDGYIAEPYFRDIFAQDVDAETAATMYAHQRSAALWANLEPSGTPSWAKVPSWYLISQQDNVIPADLQRFMAGRASAGKTTEIAASHASPVSQPLAVADTIAAALAATR
ncbi:alpha/beta hydrolase [Nocardia asteroides]|uniref:alpha/beta hydrolase n=1 Tax=Nocardia asteroides TaxID=1824 RepID=UPI001E2DF006|nr:alpha/beta hydrolase [Nocardia asteroides]UGT55198.1 alpha/beta hydrolase [Nocardia asteroides]